MPFIKWFGILCAALTITSCASMQLQEVQYPPERISLKGFSLVPLNEKGWLIAGRDKYQLALVKRGENPDETFAIQASPFRMPSFSTNEEFARLIKEGQSKDTDPQRFKMLKHDVTSYPNDKATCVQSHAVTEDRAAVKRSGRSDDMILELMTLTCAHPKDKSVGISVTFSQRYYPGQRDSAFTEKATSVLNSVELSDF